MMPNSCFMTENMVFLIDSCISTLPFMTDASSLSCSRCSMVLK